MPSKNGGVNDIGHRPIAFGFHEKFTFLVNFFQDDTFCVVRKSQSARDLADFRVTVFITLNLVK